MSTNFSPDAQKEMHLEQLMNQYGDSLLRLCYLYLKDAALAQDAVQDTFVKAWKKLDTFEGRSSEKTWLCRIAVNTCRDYKKSRWLRFVDMRRSIDEIPLPIQPVDPVVQEVYATVKALPEKYRVCVLLYYWQQMTLEEAADVLGISKSTVHHRLEKAKEMLKTELERSEMECVRM
ncbi:MAG: sigma-70 family RNA polymerase sigma factor [Clostridia bacterium]|nr:sigma-70 family RNA polymerase sigma factor [Clostridia bacterium]